MYGITLTPVAKPGGGNVSSLTLEGHCGWDSAGRVWFTWFTWFTCLLSLLILAYRLPCLRLHPWSQLTFFGVLSASVTEV